MFIRNYPHVAGHRSLNNLIKLWELNVLHSLNIGGYHVACLAPIGDTFRMEVIELSIHDYGLLETLEVLPKCMQLENSTGENQTAPPKDDYWARLFYCRLRTQMRHWITTKLLYVVR